MPELDRRRLLKWGASLGALAGVGATVRYGLLPPPPREPLESFDVLARRLHETLDDAERARACVPYDDPMRQYHNRGVGGAGIPVNALNLSWSARRLVADLFHVGLSPAGRERLPDQYFINWPGIHLMRLLMCGDPHDGGPCQLILTGPHLNLRLGGASREGVAFGGPQIYGDQRGDGDIGLPGNVYRDQLVAGQQLVAGLDETQRAAVRQARAPVQTRIALQGSRGRFAGVPVAELPPASREQARALVASILENYPEQDVAYAWECLDHNGGVDELSLSDYDLDHEGGRDARGGPSQIIRLEGPAAVFYYRGEPHLHAFFNVAMDGDRPLSVGEELGENPSALDEPEVKRFYEESMQVQTNADLAHYPLRSVAGQLRAGTIRSGDLYALESWQDRVVIAEVPGRDLHPDRTQELAADGEPLDPARTYRIATNDQTLAEEPERLGQVAAVEEAGLLRDVLIEQVRAHGFPG